MADERRCEICLAPMEQELQDYTVERAGQRLTLEEVPVWVCVQCGDMVVDEEVIEAVEELLDSIETGSIYTEEE